MIDNRFDTWVWRGLAAVISTLIVGLASHGQEPPEIVAPANGAVVAPGTVVTVEVMDDTPSVFTLVGVVAERIGFAQPSAVDALTFELAIPDHLVGPVRLSAFGVVQPGDGVVSEAVTIDVETSLPVSSLQPDPDKLRFKFVGQTAPLSATGLFDDGSTHDLTRSSKLTAVSANPEVAIVDEGRVVISTGPGESFVVLSYEDRTAIVPVFVPTTIAGDLDGDGDVDLDDANILVADPGTPATQPNDARDLNGDGLIDGADVGILEDICTSPPCVAVNQPPLADAGVDQVSAEGSPVILNGQGSADPDGDPLTYSWVQLAGPTISLADPTSATPSFDAPAVGSAGAELVFRLVVSDAESSSEPDDVVVAIANVNDPPVCELATALPDLLWPPDHELEPITIGNVADPNGDPVDLVVSSVTQDESVEGTGAGSTAPDALLQGGQALIRSERSGSGNGRIYELTFTATDGHSIDGSCQGTVRICVPHDSGSEGCTDDGQVYNSLGD